MRCNPKKVRGHSFLPELLTPNGWVLDVGCRDFGFARQFAAGGYRVLALDPDRDIEDPAVPGILFVRKALVADVQSGGVQDYASHGNGEGNCLVKCGVYPPSARVYPVSTTTLQGLQSEFGIREFDLIKIDAEGLEYDLLLSLKEPVARQISVEFHDFAGLNPYAEPEQYYTTLRKRLGDWYAFVKHDCTPMNARNPILNYWDSLLVKRACLPLVEASQQAA
jgi:hypothetical protein